MAALATLETVDVLLTDVVLPNGMLGPDIAKELSKRHPDAKVLLMSGYTGGAETGAGTLGEDYDLIQKPFTRAQLDSSLRRIIDQSPLSEYKVAQARSNDGTAA